MVDSLVESIVTALGGKISSELVAFIVSLLPVLELRGGLVAAKLMDIDFQSFRNLLYRQYSSYTFHIAFYKKNFQLTEKKQKD